MNRILAVVMLCGLASTAAADGVYVTESVGGTAIGGEVGDGTSNGMRVRIAGGIRRKNWAIEGWLAGDLSTGRSNVDAPPVACRSTGGGGGCSSEPHHRDTSTGLFSIGVDAKYIKPLSKHFEIYLRGGIGRAIADNGGDVGNGIGIGAGVQLKGKVRALGFLFWPMFFVPWGPKVTAAVFVDNGVGFYRLHGDDGGSRDAHLTHLTLGWAVGSDF